MAAKEMKIPENIDRLPIAERTIVMHKLLQEVIGKDTYSRFVSEQNNIFCRYKRGFKKHISALYLLSSVGMTKPYYWGEYRHKWGLFCTRNGLSRLTVLYSPTTNRLKQLRGGE